MRLCGQVDLPIFVIITINSVSVNETHQKSGRIPFVVKLNNEIDTVIVRRNQFDVTLIC